MNPGKITPLALNSGLELVKTVGSFVDLRTMTTYVPGQFLDKNLILFGKFHGPLWFFGKHINPLPGLIAM